MSTESASGHTYLLDFEPAEKTTNAPSQEYTFLFLRRQCPTYHSKLILSDDVSLPPATARTYGYPMSAYRSHPLVEMPAGTYLSVTSSWLEEGGSMVEVSSACPAGRVDDAVGDRETGCWVIASAVESVGGPLTVAQLMGVASVVRLGTVGFADRSAS